MPKDLKYFFFLFFTRGHNGAVGSMRNPYTGYTSWAHESALGINSIALRPGSAQEGLPTYAGHVMPGERSIVSYRMVHVPASTDIARPSRTVVSGWLAGDG